MAQIDINKKYRDKLGREVRIYSVYPEQSPYSQVHGAINVAGSWESRTWSLNGHFFSTNESESDLIEVSSYGHIKIDDKVLVWNDNGCTYKRYFAGISEDGRPMAFDDGRSSWNENIKNTWDYCELYDEEKHGKQ